ncbi:MAG: LPP20 family lipoprotein [Bacteroidales bacterium]|jgi:hypothetical protein|nr:LPP20 family lipoprotein [Bacteroidales bacterium]
MKKISLFFVCACIIASFSMVSCKSSKSISKATKATEIEVPFSGKEYKSDANFFRASQVGRSTDLATAKKIALANARAGMAQEVQQLVQNVVSQYVNQRSISNKQEYESKFEELSVLVTKQMLNNTKTMAEKTFIEKDKSYSYWVVVEMSKTELLGGIEDKITKDEKLQLDFDKYQFEKIFNEEMKKFENK